MQIPSPQRPPTPRLGPRPLAVHLATQGQLMMTWPLGLSAWNGASPFLKPLSADCSPGSAVPKADSDPLCDLLGQARDAGIEPGVFVGAVDAEARRRLGAFLDGVEGYRSHDYHRAGLDPPPVWRQGSTVLRDFSDSPPEPDRRVRARAGPPVLLVPSLINRGYILNLSRRRAFAPYLAWRGLRPILVDWGVPGEAERGFTLTDYVVRLEAALDVVRETTGRAPILLGYCMGGLLSLALAQRRQADLAGLILLATPWDFHADSAAAQGRLATALAPWIDPVLEANENLPVDLLQAAFAAIDPPSIGRKFRVFAQLGRATAAAKHFVAMEDWLNDGVPLAGAVARETLRGWYGDNTTARGRWCVDGEPVRPDSVTIPAFVVVPQRDRIVPAVSARALARALPRAEVREPSLGHVGMITGRRAVAQVHDPLVRWALKTARGKA
jgi:polyhydroxyalkanoate synthase